MMKKVRLLFEIILHRTMTIFLPYSHFYVHELAQLQKVKGRFLFLQYQESN